VEFEDETLSWVGTGVLPLLLAFAGDQPTALHQ